MGLALIMKKLMLALVLEEWQSSLSGEDGYVGQVTREAEEVETLSPLGKWRG